MVPSGPCITASHTPRSHSNKLQEMPRPADSPSPASCCRNDGQAADLAQALASSVPTCLLHTMVLFPGLQKAGGNTSRATPRGELIYPGDLGDRRQITG